MRNHIEKSIKNNKGIPKDFESQELTDLKRDINTAMIEALKNLPDPNEMLSSIGEEDEEEKEE
eukprot:CAMPEP_0116870498 /NCGR_PEP_ID=MMETSP0463-20121206/428_1 /TAXON_ID=181622 /ORGANISM="Strombidinopsis sp, Strain SopsisLIS2011" /LENGTH=62 /DNA_ID=CAMNT_0004507139 /DNA_START=1853 /DNA_END=2041 /DNA_ORIENTATION=+